MAQISRIKTDDEADMISDNLALLACFFTKFNFGQAGKFTLVKTIISKEQPEHLPLVELITIKHLQVLSPKKAGPSCRVQW